MSIKTHPQAQLQAAAQRFVLEIVLQLAAIIRIPVQARLHIQAKLWHNVVLQTEAGVERPLHAVFGQLLTDALGL